MHEQRLAEIKKFAKEFNLQFPIYYDPQYLNNYHQVYDIYSTPTTFLLDKNKKIIAKRLGVEQIEGFLEGYSKGQQSAVKEKEEE